MFIALYTGRNGLNGFRSEGAWQRMATGFWTTVSGAVAQSQNVDVIANNLANVDTAGFKKDSPTFKEYLSTLERQREPQEAPQGPIKNRDFHPIDGRDQSHVIVSGTHTNFRAGNMRVTESPLDLALEGAGFFEISTPTGIRYTKHGRFKLNQDGRLVTTDGFPVLSSQANPGGVQATQGGVAASPGAEAARFINLKDAGAQFKITQNGEIFFGDTQFGKLSVVEFADLKKLRKQGNQLFDNADPENISPQVANTIVRQGMIETSNVNPVEEMSHLIQAHRMFEHNLKAMKTYGEMMGREANDVGKL